MYEEWAFVLHKEDMTVFADLVELIGSCMFALSIEEPACAASGGVATTPSPVTGEEETVKIKRRKKRTVVAQVESEAAETDSSSASSPLSSSGVVSAPKPKPKSVPKANRETLAESAPQAVRPCEVANSQLRKTSDGVFEQKKSPSPPSEDVPKPLPSSPPSAPVAMTATSPAIPVLVPEPTTAESKPVEPLVVDEPPIIVTPVPTRSVAPSE
jgi:hypothetical protein